LNLFQKKKIEPSEFLLLSLLVFVFLMDILISLYQGLACLYACVHNHPYYSMYLTFFYTDDTKDLGCFHYARATGQRPAGLTEENKTIFSDQTRPTERNGHYYFYKLLFRIP